MTAASLLRDLTAFSMQIALVALGLAVLLKFVRIPAGARYLGLRLALVASLTVPWLLRTPEVQAPTLARAVARTMPIGALPATNAPPAAAPPTAASARSLPAIPWTQVGFGALLLGIAGRVVWLAMGVLRLLKLKRGGVVVDAPEYSELQQQLGTRATIAQVAALSQPATFGIRRPMVLLPEALAAAPGSLRRAVVTHELFHVQRRDWLAVLTEEMVRAALWFHPAIHWMTAQIQLAREEIVDELTVRTTGDRRTYVEALLAFADTPGLSPAPAFAHRRQLFHRILNVSKETVMSRPRMLSSATVLVTAVVGASWYASTLFPIVKAAKANVPAAAPSGATEPTLAQPDSRVVLNGNVVFRADDVTLRASSAEVRLEQQTSDAAAPRSVTPENPIPRRTRGVAPVRPTRFADAHVVIGPLVTLDRNGTVMSVARDACSVSGASTSTREDVCDAFFEPTAAAIRQWRYERPAQGPIQFYVQVRYQPGAEPTITQSGESYRAYAGDVQEGQRARLETDRDNEALQRAAAASLQAELARLTAGYREIERAQRLAERGLLAPDQSTLQAGMARLRAELERIEAQLQDQRLGTGDRASVERQYQAMLEQIREAEQQFRTAERGYAAARLDRAEREAADALRRAVAGDESARAQAEAATVRLREAQRKLEAAQQSPSVDGSQPLRSPSGRTPLQVTSAMTKPVVIKRVNPQHSAEAMRARVEGTVTLEVLVDERGLVADARVLKSIPLLDQSALAAAKQWEFRPALLNGEPVPVLMMLEMHFTLK